MRFSVTVVVAFLAVGVESFSTVPHRVTPSVSRNNKMKARRRMTAQSDLFDNNGQHVPGTPSSRLYSQIHESISAWKWLDGILVSVQVNVYFGFKCTLRPQIASIKRTFRNQINAIEDPDPVRMGNGSLIAYI
jgi:hypothetical protein